MLLKVGESKRVISSISRTFDFAPTHCHLTDINIDDDFIWTRNEVSLSGGVVPRKMLPDRDFGNTFRQDKVDFELDRGLECEAMAAGKPFRCVCKSATSFACKVDYCRDDETHLKKAFGAVTFDVGRLLGSGGFGTVYRASLEGRDVAIKQMHADRNNRGALYETLRAEKLGVTFSHENLVRSLAVVEQERVHNFLVIMDFAGTRNLQSILDDDAETIGPVRCLKFTHDVCRALSYLHENNFVHLDLKPANLMIDGQDKCKLGDFGCCQSVNPTGCEELLPPSPTRSYLTGTFPYRAPELLRGELPSVKADMYSLAICLWQMLSREQPYGLESHFVVIFGVVAQHRRPALDKLPNTRDSVTQSITALMKSLWKANPLDRPSAQVALRTVQELRDSGNKIR